LIEEENAIVDPEELDLEQDLATCKDSNGDTKSAEVDDERSDEKQTLALFLSAGEALPPVRLASGLYS
jgi:hypothetical protein